MQVLLVTDSADVTPTRNSPVDSSHADGLTRRGLFRWLIGGSIMLGGCRSVIEGNPVDPPFALGQATDAFWDAQQSNAEAADFIFYDHDFHNETAELTPAGWDHLLQVAVRLPHVPFPVVIERYENNYKPALDAQRRHTVLAGLAQVGVIGVDQRVVIAPAFAPGITSEEAELAYSQSLLGRSNITFSGGGNTGRSGRGGFR
jgi:hypothetical protein